MKIFDFKKLSDTLVAFIETKIELIKLDVRDHSSRFIGKAFVWMGIGAFLGTGLIFLSLGIALFLNGILDSDFLGYLIIAAFYFLVTTVLILTREKIEKRLEEKIIEANSSTNVNLEDEA